MLSLGGPPGPAAAADAAGDLQRLEIFSGFDATANARSGYGGGVWALGRDIDSPGFRLRVLGAYGEYAYDGSLPLAGGVVPTRFLGDMALGEIMAGRLWRHGELTFKAYAGIQYVAHELTPDDPSNSVNGARLGGKGQIELWRNLGARSWLSLDASYASAFGDYRVQARLGRRLARWLSAGLEVGGLGNEEYDAGRGGAFLRLHLRRLELTFAGGVTGDYFNEEASGYLSLGLYQRR